MSNFEADVEVEVGSSDAHAGGAGVERLEPRDVLIGPRQAVRRVLPNKDRRMIGAWCFLDHFGPEDITGKVGMRVPPHPHAGLQTVTWLLAGEVLHRDSLGSEAVVVPGQLNLMTSGPGISHSEESPVGHSALMHGLQLWVALPDEARHVAPRAFTQHRDLPVVDLPGLRATVVVGEFGDAASPALAYTPLLGVEVRVEGSVTFPARSSFEHGVLAIDDGLVVEGERLGASELAYVGEGVDAITVASPDGSPRRGFLLGGEPFAEELVMWWNFIGRSHEEIVAFRDAWNDGPSSAPAPAAPGSGEGGPFGVVAGFAGDRLLAPPMPNTRLRSRPRHR